MPAKDRFHDTVKTALIQDGWTITHDPLYLRFGKHKAFVDLGAEKLMAAEKEGRKIAVEVKTFSAESAIDAFEDAFGQFLIYLELLKRKEADRILYLAVPLPFYEGYFAGDDFLTDLARDYEVRMLIFNPTTQQIDQWIS